MMSNKNKFWQISLYLINTIGIAQSIYCGRYPVAIFVLFSLLLSQWLVYREEYLLKRRSKRLLDALSRCDPSSLEVFGTIRDAMSQGGAAAIGLNAFRENGGMLSVAEVSEVLSTLTGTSDKPSPPLKEIKFCQSCRREFGEE